MMHPACRARKAQVSWPVNILGRELRSSSASLARRAGESSIPMVVRYRALAEGLCQWLGEKRRASWPDATA